MPSLIALLVSAENEKGSVLTEEEVLAIRDGGHCVMSYVDVAIKVNEERGYNDIDPEDCWNQWVEYKKLTED